MPHENFDVHAMTQAQKLERGIIHTPRRGYSIGKVFEELPSNEGLEFIVDFSTGTCKSSYNCVASYFLKDVNTYLLKIYQALILNIENEIRKANNKADKVEIVYTHLGLILLMRQMIISKFVDNPKLAEEKAAAILDWDHRLLLALTPFDPGLQDIPKVIASSLVALVLVPYMLIKSVLLKPIATLILSLTPPQFDAALDKVELMGLVKEKFAYSSSSIEHGSLFQENKDEEFIAADTSEIKFEREVFGLRT